METSQIVHSCRVYYMVFIIKDAVPVSLYFDFFWTSERDGSAAHFGYTSGLHPVFLYNWIASMFCLVLFSKEMKS